VAGGLLFGNDVAESLDGGLLAGRDAAAELLEEEPGLGPGALGDDRSQSVLPLEAALSETWQ
jgi:hypothetical protein